MAYSEWPCLSVHGLIREGGEQEHGYFLLLVRRRVALTSEECGPRHERCEFTATFTVELGSSGAERTCQQSQVQVKRLQVPVKVNAA